MRWIQICRDVGVPLDIVRSRIRLDLGADYPLAFLHQRVLDVCAAEGLTCLDLRADFARSRTGPGFG